VRLWELRRSLSDALGQNAQIIVELIPELSQIIGPQPAVAAQGPIRERDIRAELGFLANDALQGRGSGTNYERVAAEYIGSQFRSFGLEPAGDADSAGTKDFVQRVTMEATRFSTPPSLTVTAGANTQTWQFGRDFLVSVLRSSKVSGELQVTDPSGSFTSSNFGRVTSAKAGRIGQMSLKFIW